MVLHKAHDVSSRLRTEDILIAENIDFKSMLLPKTILEGLEKSAYIKPSPIQKKALPLVRCGLDLIIQAKAGTGKTCVFAVAALEMVIPSAANLQVVVLAPTREIALQITDVIKALGQGIPGLKTSCFIGGYPISQDLKNIVGCHIAVGAPGRMKHLLEKGLINTSHVRLFVLDEADKLMEKTFIKDINAIFSQLPESKQVLACSATYTPELISFLNNYMHRGQYVSPTQCTSATVLLGVRQFVSTVMHHVDKLARLKIKEKRLLYLLGSVSFNQCLVFSNLHSRAVSVCNMLRGHGWSVDWIAGRQEQTDRVIALSQLKEQRVRVLVTTDLTARGIDVENVNLVINLDLPMEHQTYLHRMGRAGRYGSHGIVITILCEGEEVAAFQKMLGAIGGTSQYANLVPENLKNKDLWTIRDEDFKQVYGIVENLIDPPESSEKSSEDNTSSEEKISPPSDSDSEASEATKYPVEEHQPNECSLSKKDVCSCNLYEAESNQIEVVCGPSLFATSIKEHWQEVLPVVVNEGKIPLNTPVTLIDSKFIRVKLSNRGQNQDSENYTTSCSNIIDFKSEFQERNFFCFDEIKSTLDQSSAVGTELKKICNSDKVNLFTSSDSGDGKKESFYGEINDSQKYVEVDKVLRKYDLHRKILENNLITFDSFDIVGWMAVDESHNIVEDLNINNCDIFKYNLFKCSAGKKHITVSESDDCIFDDNNECDNHISTLNVEGLNLTSPYTLATLSEKLKNFSLENAVKSSNCKTMVSEPTSNERETKRSTRVVECEIPIANGVSKSVKNKNNQDNEKNGYSSAINKGKASKPAQLSNKYLPRVPFCVESSKSNDSKNSSNIFTEYRKSIPIFSPCDNDSNQNTSETKTKLQNLVSPVLSSHDVSVQKINQSKTKWQTSPIYENRKKYSKQRSKFVREDTKSSQSSEESEFLSSDLSGNSLKQGIRHVGNKCLNNPKQETKLNINISQNIAKSNQVKNKEEYLFESSSAYDVYHQTKSLSQNRHTSGRLMYSHNTVVPISRHSTKRNIKKHRTVKENRDSNNSYDSLESEGTTRHSFRTACSQHNDTRSDFDEEEAYIPNQGCSIVYNHDNRIFNKHSKISNHTQASNHSRNKHHETELFHERSYRCRKPAQQLNQRLSPEQQHTYNSFQTHNLYNNSVHKNSNPNQRHTHGCYEDEVDEKIDYEKREFHHNKPSAYESVNFGARSRLHPEPSRTLTGNDLFSKWYSTWYSEVRQKARQLEMMEYTNMMCKP